jgi:hypothetical protein
MDKDKLKKKWKKIWFILWQDNSLKGWIISVLFIIIIIKFVFFPVVSFAAGTELPLAIVESCSMYHQGDMFSDFDKWWKEHEDKYQEFDITKEEFKNFKLDNGFNKGDILFIVGPKPKTLEIGDIIIFNAEKTNPIIHRIVEIKETSEGKIFSTIGDNNNGQLTFEKEITEEQLVGKTKFKVAPFLGWVKLILYEPSRESSEKGFCKEN